MFLFFIIIEETKKSFSVKKKRYMSKAEGLLPGVNCVFAPCLFADPSSFNQFEGNLASCVSADVQLCALTKGRREKF